MVCHLKIVILVKRLEEIKLQKQRQANPEEHRKLLFKLIIFMVAIVAVIVGVFIFVGNKEEEPKIEHHTVEIRKGD